MTEKFQSAGMFFLVWIHILSVPIAIYYGDKADVALSIFVPFYGWIPAFQAWL